MISLAYKLIIRGERRSEDRRVLGTLQTQVPWCTGSHTERSEETVCFVPYHEPDPCDLPGGRKTFRSFIRWTDCPASAGGKTTGGCFLCVPETEFRQGIQKRQNKGSICLCLEPGSVSACVSKANQLKPYEYFSRYLGSTVYIQKTTNKKPTKKALPNWFHSIQ